MMDRSTPPPLPAKDGTFPRTRPAASHPSESLGRSLTSVGHQVSHSSSASKQPERSASSSTAGAIPINFDFILDSSLIPSLPPPGGSIGHHELMGHSFIPPGQGRALGSMPTLLPLPLAQTLSTPHSLDVGKGGTSLDVPRPHLLRRSSSYEDRLIGGETIRGYQERTGVGTRGGMAGVGAGLGMVLSGKAGHIRNWSAGSVETVKAVGHVQSGADRASSTQLQSRDETGRKGPTIASRLSTTIRGAGRASKQPGHIRTYSDSVAHPVRHDVRGPLVFLKTQHSNSDSAIHSSPNPARASTGLPSVLDNKGGTLLLADNSEKERDLLDALRRLAELTPLGRMSAPLPPPSGMTSLIPSALLSPLAIILEALVYEREVLKGSASKVHLPLMRDGTSFQLRQRTSCPAEVEGDGNEETHGLDWESTNHYVIAIGGILDVLLSHIRATKTKHSKARSDGPEEEVLSPKELLKSLRAYVMKMKKVFGQVASIYVDEYSFVRGWWDESGMKGAAGEVGRWADMLDV